MIKEWNAVELLKHSRHDWLNQIQLIKGNLALNRIDRVNDLIEQIIVQARNESKLSNLGMPQLASQLLTFNWEPHSFILEYEVIGNVCNLSEYEELLMKWWGDFYTQLEECLTAGSENHLIVTIQTIDNETKITFDFSGNLHSGKSLMEFIQMNEKSNDKLIFLESYITDHELVVTIQLK
ncbi:Spo0B C-terminal domain-containing protein [Anaerobacillus sp. MEB173]|uniref:Spo0B C-terminal domain-containing protein n=1 Tax=Anaerobacillus sp. MEB173 TaxID=3383345 RepID=UPI003F8DBF4E